MAWVQSAGYTRLTVTLEDLDLRLSLAMEALLSACLHGLLDNPRRF